MDLDERLAGISQGCGLIIRSLDRWLRSVGVLAEVALFLGVLTAAWAWTPGAAGKNLV